MSLPSILPARARALLFAVALSATAPLHALSIVNEPPPPPARIQVAGEGTPIALQSLDVRVEIVGGIARTRTEMLFANPNARVLEGELVFPLMAGQAIDGFALDIDGVLRDAVPVEKAKGKQVFEDTIRQRVDPALLETAGGNNFRLRVYPLPANGTRRVVVWTSEALEARDGQWPYRLPLSHVGKLASFAFDLRVASTGKPPVVTRADGLDGALTLVPSATQYRATLRRTDFSARGWIEVVVPDASTDAPSPAVVDAWDGARYLYVDLPLTQARVARTPPSRIALVWDSSASGRLRDHGAEFDLLDAYFKAMKNGEVVLVRVRDAIEDGGRFAVRDGDWQALKRALQTTVYDGATQLAAWRVDPTIAEHLVFSDGHANYGTGVLPSGLDAAKVRVIPVVASASADRAVLRRLARDGAAGGIVVDLSRGKEAARDALLRAGATLEGIDAVGDVDVEADAEAWSRGRLRLHGRVAGEPPRELRVRLREADGRARTIVVPLSAGAESVDGSVPLAARLWARQRIERLEGERGLYRAEIRRLGLQFGLVTRETSLIVLDTVADYARHGIEPPPAMRAEYVALREKEARRERSENRSHLDTIAAQYADKIAWWTRDFPKTAAPKPKADKQTVTHRRAAVAEAMRSAEETPAAAPAPSMAASAEESLDSVQVAGSRVLREAKAGDADGPAAAQATIALKKWTPDAPYIARLAAADADALYATYLDERADWQDSSAFYLDVADLLFERKQDALALRVLSNLAELELENRQVLRILGYRLLQAGQPALAVPRFEEVRELAPFEPQSYRDLGLALAAQGQAQKAADALYEVVARPWDGRFGEVGLIALTELNALIATHAGVETARYDARLLRNLPVDLRVVLSWDADNSDMDLWVTDPHGERAYYGHRLTRQGGRMSTDLTAGYGPEEFMLKQAIPGTYKVEVNYYGNRQQVVSGSVSLRLAFFTGFGRTGQKEQSVILRLRDRQETVLVGEFEVKPPD